MSRFTSLNGVIKDVGIICQPDQVHLLIAYALEEKSRSEIVKLASVGKENIYKAIVIHQMTFQSSINFNLKELRNMTTDLSSKELSFTVVDIGPNKDIFAFRVAHLFPVNLQKVDNFADNRAPQNQNS